MKKHRLEVLLRELAASEELPGWQDALHQMVQAELAALGEKPEKAVSESDPIIAECPLQNHDSPTGPEGQADTDAEKTS